MVRALAVIALLGVTVGACKSCHRPGLSTGSAKVEPAEAHGLEPGGDPVLLSDDYPTDEVRIELALRCLTPGVVIDNAAAEPKAGALNLVLRPDGRFVLALYAPRRKSDVRDEHGWHRLVSEATVNAGGEAALVIELHQGELALWLNDELQGRERLKTALSGDALYLGPRPRAKGGSGSGTAMQGVVAVVYLGPLDPKTYQKRRGLEL